jgi:flagellar assembly protein FliH
MGKIVKSARVVKESYRVAVPASNGLAHEAPAAPSDDARFTSATSGAFDDGFDAVLTAAEPAPVEQRIDIETLRRDAEAIVDRAASDAEQLILTAQTQALALLQQAREGAQTIEAQARESGEREGREAGSAAAHEELAPVIATMREMIESIRTQRVAAINAAEPELVRLATAIAERIIHTELVSNPMVIVENVRQALTRLVSREVVTLRVNPADHDIIRQHRDGIIAASDVEHLRIVEDQRVDRGGVVVETDAGTIDSKIATQLREAKRAILTEEQIALGDEELLHAPAQAS